MHQGAPPKLAAIIAALTVWQRAYKAIKLISSEAVARYDHALL